VAVVDMVIDKDGVMVVVMVVGWMGWDGMTGGMG